MPSLAKRIARKAFRPFYRPYYRLLWSRRFPGAATLERLVRRFEASSRRADVPLAGREWDAQYAGGRWDFLADEGEVERFRTVAALIERHAPAGEVLDVGCGEGLLRGYLEPGHPYLGIDLSREAIGRAGGRFHAPGIGGTAGEERTAPFAASPVDAAGAAGAGTGTATAVEPRGHGTVFEVADAESWPPPRHFAAVVLNECLYYFRRPLAGAHRYLGVVAPGGVMIVSMFRGPRADAIGRRLAAELPAAGETIDLERGAKRWRIAIFRPPAVAGPTAATAPPPAPRDTP